MRVLLPVGPEPGDAHGKAAVLAGQRPEQHRLIEWWDCSFCGDQHKQGESCPYGGPSP